MWKYILIVLLFAFVSYEDKKLNEKKLQVSDIEINWYQIILITSMHDQVEVSKANTTEQILKVNTSDIDTIYVKKDTIIIKTMAHPVIYNMKEKAFNYKVKIDSSANL